jgi:hypothetical protein
VGHFAAKEVRMIQQELTPQVPPPPVDDGEEYYDDEPRRRPWGAITSVVLALALVFVGYQWHQASGREQAISTQVGSLRAEAETQRLRAEEAQRQTEGLQRRITAMAADKDALTDRIAALEKAAEAKPVAARAATPRETKSAAKKTVVAKEKVATPPAAVKATPVSTTAPAKKKSR